MMPRNRARRGALAALVILTCATSLTACGSEDAVWLRQAASFVSYHDNPAGVEDVLTGLNKTKSASEALLAKAPDATGGEVATARRGLLALKEFSERVIAVRGEASARFTTADAAVPAAANVAVRERLTARAQQWLEEHGADMLKDLTCEVVWSEMTSNEQERTDADAAQLGYSRRPVPGSLTHLTSTVSDNAVTTVATELHKEYLNSFSDPEIIDWYLYARELYEKADEVASNGQTTLQSPNGWSMTRAYVTYAQICLAPPAAQ